MGERNGNKTSEMTPGRFQHFFEKTLEKSKEIRKRRRDKRILKQSRAGKTRGSSAVDNIDACRET